MKRPPEISFWEDEEHVFINIGKMIHKCKSWNWTHNLIKGFKKNNRFLSEYLNILKI